MKTQAEGRCWKFGDNIPTDQIEAVVAGVKAKLTADNIGGALKGLGGLFKK